MPTHSEEMPNFDLLSSAELRGYVDVVMPRKLGFKSRTQFVLEIFFSTERRRGYRRAASMGRLALDALERRGDYATISPVTGLPNKRALEFRAEAARVGTPPEGVSRAGAPTSWLTVYVDLNKFKPINDTYGHPQGDRVLFMAGAALRHSIRGDDDELYHPSGDEFVAFLPQRTADGVPDPEAKGRLMTYIPTRFRQNLGLIATGQGAHLLPEGYELTSVDYTCMSELDATFGFHVSEGPSIDRMQQLAIADRDMQQRKPKTER